MSFATLSKKRKKDEWILTQAVYLEGGGMTTGLTVYHGCGTASIIDMIFECRSRLESLPAATSIAIDDRHTLFGYKSSEALRSHAFEMEIWDGELCVTGSMRCGGQSSRVMVNFLFLGMPPKSADPDLHDMMRDWIWRDLVNTFEYAGTYKKPPFP
jgi:hypothetical protein